MFMVASLNRKITTVVNWIAHMTDIYLVRKFFCVGLGLITGIRQLTI